MKREKLYQLREGKKMTHEDIAKAIGISRSHYGFIENGQRNPSYDVARRLSEFFKCPIKELFPDVIFFGGRSYVEKQNNQQTA